MDGILQVAFLPVHMSVILFFLQAFQTWYFPNQHLIIITLQDINPSSGSNGQMLGPQIYVSTNKVTGYYIGKAG